MGRTIVKSASRDSKKDINTSKLSSSSPAVDSSDDSLDITSSSDDDSNDDSLSSSDTNSEDDDISSSNVFLPTTKLRKLNTSAYHKRNTKIFSGSMLWETREKQFEAFRSRNVVLPVPVSDGPVRVKPPLPYLLNLQSILNPTLPPELVEEEVDNWGIHLSFFHIKSKRFFGNTLVSDTSGTTEENIVELNQQLIYVSDVLDSDAVGVLELVVVNGNTTYGAGFAILPCFSKNSSKSLTTLPFYTGSPRLLLSLDTKDVALTSLPRIKNQSLSYFLTNEGTEIPKNIGTYVRQNEIINTESVIAGMPNADKKRMTLVVSPTAVTVPLRTDLEKNLTSRLVAAKRKGCGAGSVVTASVAARVLKIGLHNGRCFISRCQVLPLKASEGDLLTPVTRNLKFRNFVLSPLLAVVTVLQYTIQLKINDPTDSSKVEDVVVVAIGGRASCPSDGKKLYYKNKSSTSKNRIIDIQLFSGANVRPYSDGVCYVSNTNTNATTASVGLEFSVDGLKAGDDERPGEAPIPKVDRNQEPIAVKEENGKSKMLERALASTVKRSESKESESTSLVINAPSQCTPLRRSVKTMLSRYGYLLNDSPSTLNNIPDTSLSGNEISIQFPSIQTKRRIKSVYFTFQFYTCKPTKSETLFASSSNNSHQYILLRKNKKAARVIQFNVDTSNFYKEEAADFAFYLQHKSMVVTLWDADGLIQVGEFEIPASVLARKGSEVQSHAASYNFCDSSVTVLCRNEGYVGTNAAFDTDSSCEITDVNWRLCTTTTTEKKGNNPAYRVRARPLFESHSELLQVISPEEDTDDVGPPTSITEDESTLNDTEIDLLCKKFGKGDSCRVLNVEGELLKLVTKKIVLPEKEVAVVEDLKKIFQTAKSEVSEESLFKSFSDSDIVNSESFIKGCTDLGFTDIDKVLGDIFKRIGSNSGFNMSEFQKFFFQEQEQEDTYEYSRDNDTLRSAEKKIRAKVKDNSASILKSFTTSSPFLKVDFIQFLMALGFNYISQSNNKKEDSAVRERQLERLSLLKQKPKRSAAGSARPTDIKSKMEILKLYREGTKKAMIHSLLRSHITTEVRINPSFGKSTLFKFTVVNPYRHAERFKIEFSKTSNVKIVTDDEELKLLGALNEAGMMEEGQNEILVEAQQKVEVLMAYLSLEEYTNSKSKKTISVFGKSTSHGHTTSVLNVHVHPVRPIIDRSLRLTGHSSSLLTKSIRLKLLTGSFKYLYAADPNVIIQSHKPCNNSDHQDIVIKTRVPTYPESSEFYILLYDDMYHTKLFETWHVCIQSMLRVDINATMGQSTKTELVIKGDSVSRRVACYSSNPSKVYFNPSSAFTLVPNAFNRIEASFVSMTDIGEECITVHLVDVDTKELVSGWLLQTSTVPPVVTKEFNVSLTPSANTVGKKIAFTNPWGASKRYILRSSDEKIMTPREDMRIVSLPPKGSTFLRLIFAASELPISKKVYLFLNDERDQNEECLLLNITWDDYQ